VAQLLAVERRGSHRHGPARRHRLSLSQIAILSEVARRKIENVDVHAAGPLSDIAVVSGELVDAMSDIVWAINPKHDHLSNLEHRMRRFATDVLTARNIGLEFRATAPQPDLRIGADIRRQVFLIFKEAVNNIARHSRASQAIVGVRKAIRRGCLCLRPARPSCTHPPYIKRFGAFCPGVRELLRERPVGHRLGHVHRLRKH
jgi:hypothetical protein